jgi:DNA mismatch repair ATPase MutS
MEHVFLSLLFPDEESRRRHERGEGTPRVTDAVCEELGLTTLLRLKNSTLSSYFTTDEAVIAYRQATLREMEAHPSLADTLAEALPILSDIEELRSLDAGSTASGESYLYSITEIELYISCVEALKRGLTPLKGELTSPAFGRLAEAVFTLTESDYYKNLNEDLKSLSSRIREVKSITVGVNLDDQLRPKDAGVVSINAETFKSGKALDKILRMSFRNDAFTCIADIVPFDKGQSENRKEAMQTAFHSAIDKVFRSSVRAWRTIVGEYVLDNTDFLLRVLPEIEFLTRSVELIRRLKDKGYTLTYPTLRPMAERAFAATALGNPDVALRIQETVVKNDLSFDENAGLYVLTGPNRGGKSVITCALGLAVAMTMLGLPVMADEATVSPADGIYTHFPTGADDTIDKGRLGEECARLREILDDVTGESLVLLDESLSSTGAYEASFIASELLCGFAVIGCRGIFSTHLHELAAAVEEINRRARPLSGVRVDNLVAGIEEGRRSFLIKRQKPDGKSYAADIAEKYGLSFDAIRAAKESK